MKSLTFLVMVVSLAMMAMPGLVTARNHVYITNNLEGGPDLTLHCKSKDDDLGVHVLKSNEVYSFGFRDNIWGTTKFYCSFEWEGTGLHWVDVYGTGNNQCTECKWSIRRDHACEFNAVLQKDVCINYRTSVV